jgi:hypothetical protein
MMIGAVILSFILEIFLNMTSERSKLKYQQYGFEECTSEYNICVSEEQR